MHVVVVGAGVFGTWTAFHLLESGASVTLIDAYEPGHSRSSSGDETRILRCGYGADVIYAEMARQSLGQWRALDERSEGEPLWHPCGVLWTASGHDEYTQETRTTLERNGHVVEALDVGMLRHRFPHLNADGITTALFEPEAGVLMARRAVRTLASELERRGVVTMRARVNPIVSASASVVRDDGRRVEGDRFVFACGAWLPSLFPDLLGGRIRPTRQVVVYFGTPAGDRRFSSARWPAWIDFPAGIYGTPDVEGRGVKVGIDAHGQAIDPDRDDRLADRDSVDRARAWLSRRLPALANAPVVEARVCQYENTSTGDFLIDRHPERDDIWIVGGGSGHGFKHGPAVGQRAARMVLEDIAADPRFALEGRTIDVRRTVY